MRKISLTTDILPNHEIHVPVPDDLTPGKVDIVVMIEPHIEQTLPTLGDLAQSEFFGMWKDRDDIGDSAEYARKLRQESWNRRE